MEAFIRGVSDIKKILITNKKENKMNNLQKMDRYKMNLLVNDEYVYSYSTKVAKIDHIKREIQPLGWWSVTTSKHINYVGREYGYKVL